MNRQKEIQQSESGWKEILRQQKSWHQKKIKQNGDRTKEENGGNIKERKNWKVQMKIK